jgi:hypothetical protein
MEHFATTSVFCLACHHGWAMATEAYYRAREHRGRSDDAS